ncbi:MAG TPA: thiamine phosphate synthase [Rudaea sp.]|jgi:thiamine-phosphate pyrophosphorylase
MPATVQESALPAFGLYAITDGPRADLIAAAEAALRGGAAVLQYRDKTADAGRRAGEAAALAELCRRHGVPFIVNDDLELAAASGAAGVHLGESDVSVAQARAYLGADAIIGVSCYVSIERARAATAAGASYLAFGVFFPSPTKPHAARANIELLHDARPLGLPLAAIGGITPGNARVLINAGADFVAAVSGVFGGADPAAAAHEYTKCFSTRINADQRG